MLVTILVTVLLGAAAGWIASKLTNRDAEQGWIENVVVGVVGAFIGTAIFNGLSASNGTIDFTVGDFLAAVVGAILLCVVLNLVTRKRIR